VPIGGGVGKLFKLGKLPINTQLAAYCNVLKPQQGGSSAFRCSFFSRNEKTDFESIHTN
jgi:hypothetical protein